MLVPLLNAPLCQCFVRRAASPSSLNDPLDGDIQAFLTEEDQLHTYDDLTKVNPVTPTTGNANGNHPIPYGQDVADLRARQEL